MIMKAFAEIGLVFVGLAAFAIGALILFLLGASMFESYTGVDRLRRENSTLKMHKRSWEYCLSEKSQYDDIKECWRNSPKIFDSF